MIGFQKIRTLVKYSKFGVIFGFTIPFLLCVKYQYDINEKTKSETFQEMKKWIIPEERYFSVNVIPDEKTNKL